MKLRDAELTRLTLREFIRRHGTYRAAVAVLRTWPGLGTLNISTLYRWLKKPTALAYYVAFAIRFDYRLARDEKPTPAGRLG